MEDGTPTTLYTKETRGYARHVRYWRDVTLNPKKIADSPACGCGRGSETVLLYPLRCRLYIKAHMALRKGQGQWWIHLILVRRVERS
jgi:hypothetical protein